MDEETEEEMLKRVGRRMFGENICFTPEVLALAKDIYRRILEDFRRERAA